MTHQRFFFSFSNLLRRLSPRGRFFSTGVQVSDLGVTPSQTDTTDVGPGLSERTLPDPTRKSLVFSLSLFVLLPLLAALPAMAEKSPYKAGDTVVISGNVNDLSGDPIANLDIILEAARRGFALRPFGRAKKEIARQTTKTDDQGNFHLEWTYERRFNFFELIATVEVIEGGKARLQIVDRLDITKELQKGSPVNVEFILADTSFLNSLRSFLSVTSSDDEQRVYRERGRPNRVDRLETPDHIESSWWYFSQGRVLRFRDGVLFSEEEFPPVVSP